MNTTATETFVAPGAAAAAGTAAAAAAAAAAGTAGATGTGTAGVPVAPAGTAVPGAHQPPQPLPAARLGDVLFALSLMVLGFCFWEWGILASGGAGIATTLFFLFAIVASYLYLRSKGIRQNAKSRLLLIVALAGAAPFALYGFRSTNFPLLAFEMAACLLWVAYSCRTTLTSRLSGIMAGDLLNQAFIVPFANFAAFFTRPFSFVARNGAGHGGGTRRSPWLVSLLALAGVAACIPVLALVIHLLASSDDGFRVLINRLGAIIALDELPRYAFELIFGIPIAAYLFGAVVGNAFRRYTASLSAQSLYEAFSGAHALPRAVLYAPLALFAALYVIYFIAMGSYLFSALSSELPSAYTYAQYARRGFFELCGVAAINLTLLAGVWLFARRGPAEHPLPLRVLSGLLSLLTCLLIVTAASKMLLYIGSYGLTPPRIYTTWFMGLMLLVFLVLVAWHLKPFNAARPLILLVTAAVLALGLTNTGALIAGHNVQRYLDGRASTVDVDLLEQLGDPAVPALYRLQEAAANKNDAELERDTTAAIGQNRALHEDEDGDQGSPPADLPPADWRSWTLASHEAARLHALHGG